MDTHFHGVPMVVAQFTSFPPLSLGRGGDEGEHTTHLEHLLSFSLIKNMKKKREKSVG
jgi:hypothetical protein